MGEHPDVEQIVAFAQGGLSVERAKAVEAHCRDCDACGDQLAALLLLRATPRVGMGRVARPLAVAAAVLVAVLALGVLWSVGSRSHSEAVGPEGMSETSELAALAPDGPPHELVLVVRFPPGASRATEGGADVGTADAAEEYLRAGLVALTAGNARGAIEPLKRCLALRPEDPEASAYLGIAHYLIGDDLVAAERLLRRAVVTDRVYGAHARFYLAGLHLRRGEGEEALALVRGIEEAGGALRRRVEALRAELEARLSR